MCDAFPHYYVVAMVLMYSLNLNIVYFYQSQFQKRLLNCFEMQLANACYPLVYYADNQRLK